MMKLLAFDTACDACSVVLWRDGVVVARRARAMQRGQSEALVPMIDEVMREADTDFTALSAAAVTNGPGAFTGLRIGLATARAIALAADRPVLGVSTFDAIAFAARREAGDARALVVAIETKRDDLYLQVYALDATALGFSPRGDAAVLMPADAAAIVPAGRLLLAGDGAARLSAALGDPARVTLSAAQVPDATDVAAIAAARLAAGVRVEPLRPLYLRAPAVRLPQPSRVGSVS
jgi:tRNA threonylcarbamoyladenosine biosynthesis protein TsaB